MLGNRQLGIWLAMLAIGTSSAWAVPASLSKQGKLLDGAGTPVPDGVYSMEFRFYDSCVGGNLLLTDTHAGVSTHDGIYSVLLGSGNVQAALEPDLVSVFRNHDTVCLGVRVEDDSEMTPRQPIVSSGFAMRSAMADAASPSSTLITATDDVTWSGRHTFLQSSELEASLELDSGGSIGFARGRPGDDPTEAGFRITTSCTAINQGSCSGSPGTGCWGDADCPEGQTCDGGHPNGECDESWFVCYNCPPGSTAKADVRHHSWNQKIEANYWDGEQTSLEYNWNYRGPNTTELFRPFDFRVFIDGPLADTAYLRLSAYADTGPHLMLRNDGFVEFGKGLVAEITRSGPSLVARTVGLVVAQTIETTTTDPGDTMTYFGGTVGSAFLSDTPDARVASLQGLRAYNTFGDPLSGPVDGREVEGNVIGIDVQNRLTQTGDDAHVGTLVGMRYVQDLSGQNVTVASSQGVSIETPVGAGAGTVVHNHYGLLIKDQRSLGSTEGDALRIAAQIVSPDPARGNLRLSGGGWNDGHLRLGAAHVWKDDTGDMLRFKDGTPASESDGTPLHSPPGTGAGWGGSYWGDSTSPGHDSGDEVCTLAGLSCKRTYDVGDSTPRTCASTTHATPEFLVLCY